MTELAHAARPVDAAPPRAPTFREVFDAELPYVIRTLRRLGVREREVEDVAQEVFERVLSRFDDLDPSRPIRPWLFAFARMTAANHGRLARHRELPSDDAGVDRASPTDPEADAHRSQARERILRALEGMTFELRSVIVMHELDGFTAPEIAEVLGVPINTVYSRVRAARAELREALVELRDGGRT